MTTKAVALLERYSNYDGMGIPNLAGCKEAMRVAVDALKEACPELRESEDERIRKELLDAVDKARVFDIDEDVADRWTAWLEKQKEQKPVLKFKVGDRIHLIDGTSPDYEDDCITIGEIGTFNYFGKFKEGSVPIKDQDKWELVEQKPAEWSEEDESMIEDIIWSLDCLKDWIRKHDTDAEHNPSFGKIDSEIDWLESLPMRCPKKSDNWKPSEEQMKALEDAFRKDGSDEYRKTINSLYQTVKPIGCGKAVNKSNQTSKFGIDGEAGIVEPK